MSIERYELANEQWNQVKDLLPIYHISRPPKNNRMMFNAVLWIVKSGAAWRELPKEHYGS